MKQILPIKNNFSIFKKKVFQYNITNLLLRAILTEISNFQYLEQNIISIILFFDLK